MDRWLFREPFCEDGSNVFQLAAMCRNSASIQINPTFVRRLNPAGRVVVGKSQRGAKVLLGCADKAERRDTVCRFPALFRYLRKRANAMVCRQPEDISPLADVFIQK